MPEAGEKDQPHQRLDRIQQDIDEARTTAEHLAQERVINPEEVEDTDPAEGAPRPRG